MIGPGAGLQSLLRRHPAPLLTVATFLLAFGAISLARADTRYWAFFAVVTILAGMLAIADHRVRFTHGVMWLLAALAVLHLSGGLLPPVSGPTFYETWIIPRILKYDQAVHFFGSGVATLVAWQILGCYVDPERTSTGTQALVAAFFALGKGALNEVVEFLLAAGLTRVFPGDVVNSEWDLLFNAAGALAVALFLRSGVVDRHLQPARSAQPV